MAHDARQSRRVAELSEDLRRYLAGLSVSAYSEPPWEGAVRWFRKHHAAALTGLGVNLAGAATVLLILNGIHSKNLNRAEELKTLAIAAEQNGEYSEARGQWLRIRELFLIRRALPRYNLDDLLNREKSIKSH